MNTSNDCVFCKAPKEEKYKIIAENENAYAIIAIDAQIDCLSIVLPYRHVTDFKDLTSDESLSIHKLVDELTDRMDEVLGCSTIASINGKVYRTQPHIHYQLFPLPKGLKTIFGKYFGIPKRRELTPEALESMARKLRF